MWSPHPLASLPSCPLSFFLWFIIISHIPSVLSEHWGLSALVSGLFFSRCIPFLFSSPPSSQFYDCPSVALGQLFHFRYTLCPALLLLSSVSFRITEYNRITELRMNEKMDSVKQMMAQFNALWCCGVWQAWFVLQGISPAGPIHLLQHPLLSWP